MITAPHAVSVAADLQAFTGTATYFGLVLEETASGAATVKVYDGTDATGKLIDVLELVADGTGRTWFGPCGIRAYVGVFVDVVAGAVEGSVLIG
jgi:hypothetical protein